MKKNEKWVVNLKNKGIILQDYLDDVNADINAILQLNLNIYRVLFTRARKGIYVWFKDEETKKHFLESKNK